MNEYAELEICFTQSSINQVSVEELLLIESVMPDLAQLFLLEQSHDDE